MDKKLVEKAVRRTKEIAREKNFHTAMRLAVDEAGLPEEERAVLMHLVAQEFGRRSAEARERNKIIKALNEQKYREDIALEMAERARSTNEHTHPVD